MRTVDRLLDQCLWQPVWGWAFFVGVVFALAAGILVDHRLRLAQLFPFGQAQLVVDLRILSNRRGGHDFRRRPVSGPVVALL